MITDVINDAIRERGITVAELARRTSINDELLRRSLNGSRVMRAVELVAICHELNLEIQDFTK